jgi:hypothetical protein
MRSKSQGFVTRMLMLAMGILLVLPVAGFAQWQDDRWRNDRRRERREERRERREERRERRQERRGRDWDRYGNYGGNFQLRQTALNAGYNSGVKEGRKDRDRGDRFDYRDEGDYQNATKDYNSRYGDRELYRRYFREGFANGYEDGYRGY